MGLNEILQGEHLDLSKQAALFNIALVTYLQPGLKTRVALSRHLAKSIFVFCIGSNDFGLIYLRMNQTSRPKPEEFVKRLSDLLARNLELIYKSGARKFLVFNIPPVGCPPGFDCAQDPNVVVNMYNRILETKIKQLRSRLPNSFIVLADIFKLVRTILDNPSAYGEWSLHLQLQLELFGVRFFLLSYQIHADISLFCGNIGFKVDVEHPCLKDHILCANRDEYLLWDGVHPTQAADKVFALNVFNGTGFTRPANLISLIKL